MNATVVAFCECGSTQPMLVPAIPGAGGGAQCSCGLIWAVASINYTEPDRAPGEPQRESAKVDIVLKAVVPTILPASRV